MTLTIHALPSLILIILFILFIEINDLLQDIAALSYPTWLTNAAPFLPKIDLKCVTVSGMSFLDEAIANSNTATVTGFLNAITAGCSTSSLSLSLRGGYNNDKEELEINIVVELNASRTV